MRARFLLAETPQTMQARSAQYYMAVYESKGQILGLIGLDMNEIRILCVAPSRQREGIGQSLVEHIQLMVPDALFRDVFVYASSEAVGFYRICGFEDKGIFLMDVGGEPLKTTFMTRPNPFIR
jgi:N-acetylglutamate synthase-like GNAT family acetyltransferase